VRKYWVTSTVFGLIVSTLTWAGLAAYGVPLAIVWAVLAFVTNYIPNIGFVIGLVPAAVMGLLAKGPWGALYVIALYAVLNFVIQGVIQPKVAGEAVGVTSTVSFLSLLVWAVVLGPLGALLALPATLFVKALVVDADPQARWLNALIASNPRTSSEEPVLVPEEPELVAEEVAPVDPVVASDVPAESSGVIVDEPRRSLGDQPADEAAAIDEVVPRHSADPETEEPEAAPLDAVTAVAEPLEADAAVEPVAEPVEASTTEDADAASAEVAEPVAQETEADVAEPVEETEPEDVPRRARADADARVVDDEAADLDDLPLFQKSATPYWTGASTHAED
jgi:hypothetical protein